MTREKNEALVKRFLDECRLVRNLSPNTVTSYESRLGRFLDFLRDVPVTDLNRRDVQDFLMELREEGLTASSLQSYITCLRSFGSWLEGDLWDEGWRNVFRTIDYPKLREQSVKTIPADKVDQMIDHMPRRTPTQYRNRALVAVAYSTALRASEVVGLNLKDLDLDNGLVYVENGKGGKDRFSLLDRRARHTLREWLDKRSLYGGSESEAVFVGRGSDRLTRQALGNVVRRAAKRVGVKATPHTLRRSRATHWRDMNVPLWMIQKLLGHANPTVTDGHYLATNPLQIANLFKELMEEQTNDTARESGSGVAG